MRRPGTPYAREGDVNFMYQVALGSRCTDRGEYEFERLPDRGQLSAWEV